MSTMPERMTRVETQLEDIGTKVSELHSHFLRSKGAKEARGRFWVAWHVVIIAAASVLSGFAAAATVIKMVAYDVSATLPKM